MVSTKRVRLVNPGRRRNAKRKKLTPKQIKYFGTKRQKAALKRKRRSNVGKKRNTSRKRNYTTAPRQKSRVRLNKPRAKPKRRTNKSRRKNVGEIIRVDLPYVANTGRKRGRKRNMARKRRNSRRRNRSYKRRNYGQRRVRRTYNAPRRRRRRRSTRRRSYRRRRNPGMLTGSFGTAIGVISGASLTKVLTERLLPTNLLVGMTGYISTAIVAVLSGQMVGRFLKNKKLGNDVTTGGFTYLTLRFLADNVPGLPVGLSGGRGMGLISPSSFYTPQVPQPGSMTRFVRPAAVPAYTPPPANNMRGLAAYTAPRGPRVGRMG